MSASRRGAVDVPRLAVATVMVMLLLAVMSWLQGRFDHSDHEKATELVKLYRPPAGGVGLTEAILARHPGVRAGDLSYSSEIRQSCLGHVRVSIYVPRREGRASDSYAFDVALTGPSVHPTDERTVGILMSLSSTTAVARTATRTSTAP
jgi:hypothetical protein